MVAAGEYKEAFDIFDPEKTGGLDCENCGNVMRSLGQNPSMKEVEDLFAKHSKGGKIDADGLVAIATEFEGTQAGKDLEAELRDAFKAYDKDGHGMVGAAEIRNLISNLPTVVDEIEVDDIMKEADPGETGQIDYTVFSKMIYAPLPGLKG